MMRGMPDEQDELEQAWQALADRERLLNQTIARRSSEIDARARRYEAIGADLDARRLMIEESEDDLAEREQRLGLAVGAHAIGIMDWHIPSGRVVWNPEAIALFSLPPGVLEGDIARWRDRIVPEDQPRLPRE